MSPSSEYFNSPDLKLVKKFCPFLSGTHPMAYTTLTVPGCGAINKYEKKNTDAFIANTRNEMVLKKCPDDLHFEYDVHIVTYSNARMLNMVHMYHGCLRENCMMWDSPTQICRMGSRKKPAPPSFLVNEFLTKTDCDKNGMVYGVDFVIKDDSAPSLIRSFTTNIKLDTIDKLKVLTWPEYLQTIKWDDDDCYYYHDPFDGELHHDDCTDLKIDCGLIPMSVLD